MIELDIIAIVVSIGSGIFSVIMWKKSRSLEQKYHGFEARQRIDDVISTSEFKLMKQKVIQKYFELTKNGKTEFILSNSDVAKETLTLEHGFNKVCSWYEEEDWVDVKNFDKTYAGNIVNSWNLLERDILHIRKASGNENFCKHFQTIAKKYMDSGISAPLYDLNK